MNRSELTKALAANLEVPTAVAKGYLDTFEAIVTDTVADGDPVVLSGFCKFERKTRAARTGRNPMTGEAIDIPEKTVVKITPLKGFKDAVL